MQPAGSGGFTVAYSGARGWNAPRTGVLETLSFEPSNQVENCWPTASPFQALTLDQPAPPRPPETNSMAALNTDLENVPMLQDPPVSRYGPKNVWRLLYEEGERPRRSSLTRVQLTFVPAELTWVGFSFPHPSSFDGLAPGGW